MMLFFIKSFYSIRLYEYYDIITEHDGEMFPEPQEGGEIFKSDAEAPKDSSFFPVVFPLFAGAGALTTMLSIRAQYASVNILGAILMNCLVIYIGLKITKNLEKVLGAGGIYMLKKFFGIILLAISVKLFTTNLTFIIENILHVAK